MRGATTCTGRPSWSRSDRAAPAQVDRAGTLRNRDVEASLLVVQRAGARQRTRFGNVVQPGMDAALSRQRSRVQIPSFPLIVWSITAHQQLNFWVRGSTGERSVRIREIEGSIPSVSTTRVHGSTGERSHGMREIEGSIPSGSTNVSGSLRVRGSMGEHSVCTREIAGSSPVVSTSLACFLPLRCPRLGTLAWYARGLGSTPSSGSTMIDQGSSNGRTLAFGTSYEGSIPSP